ncbi:hypothetical protein A3L22_22215 [Streptomyces griseus subsp. griseus]|nr:hypothetical protein A3L22_22215 [Streptomyces griseus subsp. griseus]
MNARAAPASGTAASTAHRTGAGASSRAPVAALPPRTANPDTEDSAPVASPSLRSSTRSGTRPRAAGTSSIWPRVSRTTNAAAGSRPPGPAGVSGTAANPVATAARPVASAVRGARRRADQRVSGHWRATTSSEDRAKSQPSAACEPVARSTSAGSER